MKTLWQTGVCPKCGAEDRFTIRQSEFGDLEVICNKCGWWKEYTELDWDLVEWSE